MLTVHGEEIALAQAENQIVQGTNGAVEQGQVGIQAGNLVRVAAAGAAQAVLAGVLDGAEVLVRRGLAVQDFHRCRPAAPPRRPASSRKMLVSR